METANHFSADNLSHSACPWTFGRGDYSVYQQLWWNLLRVCL